MGFYSQEYWSGLPIPSPGDLPTPGTEPGPLALQADSLPSEVILKQKQLASDRPPQNMPCWLVYWLLLIKVILETASVWRTTSSPLVPVKVQSKSPLGSTLPAPAGKELIIWDENLRQRRLCKQLGCFFTDSRPPSPNLSVLSNFHRSVISLSEK